MAAGVAIGDEVITTTFSFFATAGVIARLGARPVFVDIEPNGYNLDSGHRNGTEAANESDNSGASFWLLPADGSVLRCSCRAEVSIIEDAAQAIGANNERHRWAGTMGSLGCFSFFPRKGAFGGAILPPL
jgi:dTDP-4-amino-4,6-dideoxygalactose transaminase